VLPEQSPSVEWWRHQPAATARPELNASVEPERAASQLPFWSLLSFTVVLIGAPQEFIPALAPFRLPFLFAVGAALAQILSANGLRVQLHREVVIVACLVGWAVLTLPWSYWPGGSVDTLTSVYLKSVVVFWLLGTIINSDKRLRTIIWTLSLLTVPLAVTGLLNYGAGALRGGRIIGYEGGLTANPNDLALMLNIIWPLTASVALSARRLTTRWIALGLVGVSMATIIVTFSRAGFLTMAFTSALFLLRLAKRGSWITIGAVACIGVFAVVNFPSGYAQRLLTITSIESDPTHSAENRWRDMVDGAAFVVKHPIVGAGLGADILALNEIRGPSWVNVHNAYLKYGMELGLPGLTLFVALILSCIRGAARVERGQGIHPSDSELAQLAGGIRISLWGFALAAFFYPVAYHFYFYYLAGLAVALRTISSRGPRVALAA